MSDIPDHQLVPCPPFTFISVDFAGPYRAKAMGNSRSFIKTWGLVIICQNTRAIKMIATAGYSTDNFLTAYHRFVANYGNPSLVVSDAGSQLKASLLHLIGINYVKVLLEMVPSGVALSLAASGETALPRLQLNC